MALELEVEADHIQMIRAVETVHARRSATERKLPMNIDGAIAAVCSDIGMPATHRQCAVHHFARAGHRRACRGRARCVRQPMRQIDPKDHIYDGPSERRLPERRK